jgi:hypothetical protein
MIQIRRNLKYIPFLLINIFGLVVSLARMRFFVRRIEGIFERGFLYICTDIPFIGGLVALLFIILSFIKLKKFKTAFIFAVVAIFLLMISGAVAFSPLCWLE